MIKKVRDKLTNGKKRGSNGMNTELVKSTEMIAMFILQFKECKLDHSLQITKTLNKANAEFKNYGYTRFRYVFLSI